MLKHIQPSALPESAAPFSQVVVDDCYAFLSGIVAADFPSGMEVLGDAGAETRAVLATIGAILEELELHRERIVKVDVHLLDLDDFDVMDDAYREFFDSGRYPARTTVECGRLFGDSRVEISCQVRL